ncbi:hypothetical protein ACI79C_08900 [Geodermatophilus sp. SYSU D00697]
MERAEASRRWRTRLVFSLLFVLLSAGVAMTHLRRGDTVLGWVWVALAAVSAALALVSWVRLRRGHSLR